MSKAKNKVIAGQYSGRSVSSSFNSITINAWPPVNLDKYTVEAYELITDDKVKSMSSGVTRGLIGGALLGPVGMLAGGLSAKTNGIYTVAIKFRSGEESLLEIDDKCYKMLLKKCF